MGKKIYFLSVVLFMAMVFMTSQVMGQESGVALATAIGRIPGWGVQAYLNGEPWNNLVAQAFHLSLDGSFYEVSDEEFQLKIAVTFQALINITGHKIPIDASCGVSVILDGVDARNLVNEHTIIQLDFTEGIHTLEMINSCGMQSNNWMGIVVGKCLWGTNPNIKFIKAGAN